jgi:nucleoside phosphorylase
MAPLQALPNDKYTVGWICALPSEMAAAEAMLDEIHEDIQEPVLSDNNSYTLGRIRDHNVVIASLPAGVYGIAPAATVAKDMLRTFKHVRFGLMVGIGGGIPSDEHDIRLGDIVVSQPSGTSGGVIQHDRGKTTGKGEFERTGTLNSPPTSLLSALARLKSKHEREDSKIPQFLDDMTKKFPKMKSKYTYQGTQNDHLFQAEYDHPSRTVNCKSCDASQEVVRNLRDDTEPRIHYGNIASGNQVIKNGVTREQLRNALGVLCVEMEAAGLMSDFPCFVIRGICDYSDSHKNKAWQEYAAATAAAFAKELLYFVSAKQVLQEKTITEVSGK